MCTPDGVFVQDLRFVPANLLTASIPTTNHLHCFCALVSLVQHQWHLAEPNQQDWPKVQLVIHPWLRMLHTHSIDSCCMPPPFGLQQHCPTSQWRRAIACPPSQPSPSVWRKDCVLRLSRPLPTHSRCHCARDCRGWHPAGLHLHEGARSGLLWHRVAGNKSEAVYMLSWVY